ncbi:MAG: CPBP family glutamic-type intramembrane protease [Bryobacteraceae bacterium]|jgi:membrane protease YdiL (CAAX protease family)
MAQWLRGYRGTLWIGWAALCVVGISYARVRGVPGWVAAPALAAFLVAYPFYLVAAFPSVRERVAGPRLPFFLTASIALPYLAACGAGVFHWIALAKLVAVALALGLWFFALPAGVATDVGFLALVAAILLEKYFDGIYPQPYRGVDLSILGKIAVFQMAPLALMLARRAPETGYGFLPTRREWRIGALHFVYFAPVGLPLALIVKAARFSAPASPWLIAGTFLGMLWVVALFEEFLFRGVLQPMIEHWTRSRAAGLLLTSLLFGLAHLSFRTFPNWRWVLVAGTLGWFCGRARNQAGGIRAGMVTHALAVTAWRAFFV